MPSVRSFQTSGALKFSTAARSEARLRGRGGKLPAGVRFSQQHTVPSRPCLPQPAQAGENPDFGNSVDTEERAAPPLPSPPRRRRTRAPRQGNTCSRSSWMRCSCARRASRPCLTYAGETRRSPAAKLSGFMTAPTNYTPRPRMQRAARTVRGGRGPKIPQAAGLGFRARAKSAIRALAFPSQTHTPRTLHTHPHHHHPGSWRP